MMIAVPLSVSHLTVMMQQEVGQKKKKKCPFHMKRKYFYGNFLKCIKPGSKIIERCRRRKAKLCGVWSSALLKQNQALPS